MADPIQSAAIGKLAESPLSSIIRPVAAALVAHLALLTAYLAAFHGDPSSLICADREMIGQWPFEAVRVGFAKGGYDGQFYYAIARNPWHRSDAPLDVPALRHVRILFPALGWLFSGGGDAQRLLWVLPALNLACVAGLAWLGAIWARRHGRSPMWGSLLPIVVNAGTPLLRDLTDPLATLAVTALVVPSLLECGALLVAGCALAAVLSREQNAAIVLIVLLDAAVKRRWSVYGALAAVLAAFVALLLAMHATYGTWPVQPDNLSAPLAGIAHRLQHLTDGGRTATMAHLASMTVLATQMGVSVAAICLRPRRSLVLVTLAGLSLAVLGGIPLYESGYGYTRVFVWMPLGVWLWSMESNRRWPVWLLTPAILWPCFAVVQAWSARV